MLKRADDGVSAVPELVRRTEQAAGALRGGRPSRSGLVGVTQVYRRSGDAWELVHRHADPLVRPIGIDQAAALAHG